MLALPIASAETIAVSAGQHGTPLDAAFRA